MQVVQALKQRLGLLTFALAFTSPTWCVRAVACARMRVCICVYLCAQAGDS